ncbi:MAG: hypothetical protein KA297_31290 [Kofleriaceae bacterium]|nr:hypothetical protein [Kofleriaceae bacterium]
MALRPTSLVTAFAPLLAATVLTSCGGGGDAGPDAASGPDAAGEGEPQAPIDCTAVPCRYVAPTTRGDGSGRDWANASGGLPSSPERGSTYLFADGAYGALRLDSPDAGGAIITLAKALTDDHGTDVGWTADDGDGQAELTVVELVTDDWVIDGRRRDPMDWQRSDAYGFRITGTLVAHTINFGRPANRLRFRYLDVGGQPRGGFDPDLPREAFYLGGFDQEVTEWHISACHVHDVYLPFQIVGGTDITVERTWLGPSWSKEAIRGQGVAARLTIRDNVFKDACQGTPGDPTATGCTAQIAAWDGGGAGAFDGTRVWGNLFWMTQPTAHSDACVFIGGDGGVSAAGVSASDVVIHHNTFVGIVAGTCSVRTPGDGTGTAAHNNLWVGLGAGVRSECDTASCEGNVTQPDLTALVGADQGDFHLAIDVPGSPGLASPFDVDPDGRARGGDGIWDAGAFER